MSNLSSDERRGLHFLFYVKIAGGTVPASGTNAQLLIICSAPFLPSFPVLSLDGAGAGHSPTRFSQVALRWEHFHFLEGSDRMEAVGSVDTQMTG